MNKDFSPHYAIVSMFGSFRKCRVKAYGSKQSSYSKDEMLWVERAEDEYGILSMKKPFCVLYREDWLNGETV